MTTPPVLHVEDRGAVRRLELNRPHSRNALNPELVRALARAVEDVASADDIRIVVIAGRGPSFCAGADLTYLHQHRGGDEALAFLSTVSRCLSSLAALDKPVVAAVHGHAVAGGLELALACDVIVAERDSLIGDGHAAMGLLPAGGSSVRLPQRFPVALARWMLLSGELLTAQELHRRGAIHAVARHGQLDAVVSATCHALLTANATAQAATKALLRALDGDTAAPLAYEQEAFARHWRTADMPELETFVGRRNDGTPNLADIAG